MIIDSDKHPERNVYFIGARQLALLQAAKAKQYDIQTLFRKYNKTNHVRISFDYHLLGLDWLFILGLVESDDDGNVLLCS